MDYYVPNGKLSLKVSSIRKVGLGDLLAKLEELRQKLIAEGVIDPSKRQALPFLPRKVGLITGKNSDAEKDVLENSKLRWPAVQFEVINTPVQGEAAPPAVIKAIQALDADPEVDVIIIARGGGAFLDLIVFSDEALVRAAAAAKTPIVSAIGHENDSPLLDAVADVRASTPTDAAKRVVPDAAQESANIEDYLARMVNRIANFIHNQSNLIEQIRSRPILANPFGFIDDKTGDLERAVDQLRGEMVLQLDRADAKLESDRGVLRSLSPQGVLDRGYAVVRDSAGHVVNDASKVKTKETLKIRLAKGEIEATAND
jgi:exodeoxyribonuclease VII large subunit